MSLAPVSYLSDALEDYPNNWIKFYESGTTTPKTMATDSSGGTLLAKAEISGGGTVPIGFIKTAGDAIFIPWVDGAYDLFLFPTEAEADANDTSNAIQLADDINSDPSAETLAQSDARYSAVFGNVSDMVALTMVDGGTYVPLSGQDVYLTSYYESIPFDAETQGGEGHYRVMTLAEYALTPDEVGAAFTVGGFAFVIQGTPTADRWGVIPDGGVTDYTSKGQAFLDYISANQIGFAGFPVGTIKGNFIVDSDCVPLGRGIQGSTVFKPAIDDHVFKAKDDAASVVRIGLYNMRIEGEPTFLNQSGFHLEVTTAGTFIDTVRVENVFMLDCGKHGIKAIGTSNSGPFVQKLTINNCDIRNGVRAGLSLDGAVLETGIQDSFIVNNGGDAGTYPNSELLLGGGNTRPQRVTCRNVSMNHAAAHALSNPATCLDITGVDQLTIYGGDIESSNPAISLVGNSGFITSIGLYDITFQAAVDPDEWILINNVRGFQARGCSFTGLAPAFRSTTNGVNQTRIDLDALVNDNTFDDGATPVVFINSINVASGSVPFYFKTPYTLDTEGFGPTDTLVNIFGPNATDVTELSTNGGEMFTIRTAVDGRDITVQHSAGGNIRTLSSADVILSDTFKSMTLRWQGTFWAQVSGAV